MVGNERPTLLEYLGTIEIARLAKKGIFRGYEVPAMPFLERSLWLFLEGVVLGRARSDRLDQLTKIFVGLPFIGNRFAEQGFGRERANALKLLGDHLRMFPSKYISPDNRTLNVNGGGDPGTVTFTQLLKEVAQEDGE